jgi:2-desacetyl-2-hydroxyethyl bacteriochlorophyllide A dehydrogenase
MRLEVLGVHRDGGMTELLSLPEANLLPADGLTVDQCATVEFLAIGAHAVRRGQAAAGDRVLVVGAGPIGLGAALFAGLAGAEVTVLDGAPDRLAAVERILGIRSVLLADGSVRDRVAELTTGEGFDLVFDATGNRAAMEAGFDLVGHGGRYVLVGIVRDAIRFEDPDFHKKELSLLGSRNATVADLASVMDRMKAGQVPVEQLITHRTTLAEAATDLPRWAVEKTGLTKAMIEMA